MQKRIVSIVRFVFDSLRCLLHHQSFDLNFGNVLQAHLQSLLRGWNWFLASDPLHEVCTDCSSFMSMVRWKSCILRNILLLLHHHSLGQQLDQSNVAKSLELSTSLPLHKDYPQRTRQDHQDLSFKQRLPEWQKVVRLRISFDFLFVIV